MNGASDPTPLFTLELDLILEAELPADARTDQLTPMVELVLERERQSGEWAIAIMLTSDASLRALHHQFMGIDAETDVMTFPYGEPMGGDIVVSVERATEQGPQWDHTAWEEIRFLIVHGVLHLCGWSDAGDERRAAMLERQHELIADFERSAS